MGSTPGLLTFHNAAKRPEQLNGEEMSGRCASDSDSELFLNRPRITPRAGLLGGVVPPCQVNNVGHRPLDRIHPVGGGQHGAKQA